MTTAQTQGLIGMLTVLGILVLLVTPALVGIVRDRRLERQIRRAAADRRYFTTTLTHHS
ncbi:hypothetical protein ACIPSE_07615 [Streptomyces sp. NPDC090106]|uniref:hypothetical protein n=1 Tax=Streptomyces sp. NPDC090106 TaxID=3365946 RepID=UPI0037FF137D